MLNMDGPEHLRMRKLQVNGYSPKTLESNLDVAHDATRRAIEEWPQGRPVGVQRAMQKIIAEQIGLCCTGVSPGAYIDDLIDFLGMIVTIHITKRWPPLVERLPKYRRARRRLRELYEQILEAHRPERRAGEKPDFVDDLLEMNRTDPQFLPETDLRANILAPYLVGIDTSASVCAFMLYALLKHPDLLERMRVEVDEMYERGPPTPEGLRKLDVTHRVALETLRMYPIIPALTRTDIQLVRIRGIPRFPPARSSCLERRSAIICRSASPIPSDSISNAIRRACNSTGSPARSPRSAWAGTAASAADSR